MFDNLFALEKDGAIEVSSVIGSEEIDLAIESGGRLRPIFPEEAFGYLTGAYEGHLFARLHSHLCDDIIYVRQRLKIGKEILRSVDPDWGLPSYYIRLSVPMQWAEYASYDTQWGGLMALISHWIYPENVEIFRKFNTPGLGDMGGRRLELLKEFFDAKI